jgi:hypothetical protein
MQSRDNLPTIGDLRVVVRDRSRTPQADVLDFVLCLGLLLLAGLILEWL